MYELALDLVPNGNVTGSNAGMAAEARGSQETGADATVFLDACATAGINIICINIISDYR